MYYMIKIILIIAVIISKQYQRRIMVICLFIQCFKRYIFSMNKR